MTNKTIDCNFVNGFCIDNVTDNRRYRSKTYAEVVPGTPNASGLNVEMKDAKINEVVHQNKEGINLTYILENLLRDNSGIPLETLSPPKICTDTSLSGNTSNVLCTLEDLYNQDFLKSFDDIEKPAQRPEGKTNDSIQNKTSVTTGNLDYLDISVQRPSST